MISQLNKKELKAFSLVELLVAIAIIGVGLVGISSLAVQNIRVQYHNRNSLISSQLAQEGIELVRNIRDNDWKSDSPNMIGNYLGSLYNDRFIIDCHGYIRTVSANLEAVPFLNIDNDGFYSYSEGVVTPFKRVINADCYDNYCLFTASVYWQGQAQSGSYQVKDYLYAWYQED